jgi:hypothetical protein
MGQLSLSRFKYRSYEECISDLESRKNLNISSEYILSFSPLLIAGKIKCYVMYNEKEEICDSLCTKCLSRTGLSPIYNGKYVYPLCRLCMLDLEHLDNSDKRNVKMTKNKKNNVSETTIDWTDFEKSVNERTAKLVKLAEKYNLYPADMKQAIIDKYGKEIAFKKGRNGGIFWSVSMVTTNV